MMDKFVKKAGISANRERWRRWCRSFSEEKPRLAGKSFSPLMYLFGCMFFLLRRISIWEHLKHYLYDPLGEDEEKITPAWFVDIQVSLISIQIYGGGLLIWFFESCLSNTFSGLCLSYIIIFYAGFLIIQIAQRAMFDAVWRVVVKQTVNILPYSHVRNLLYTFNSYSQIIWLFGIIYWLGFRNDFAFQNCPKNLFDCIYYSAVTATTIGYGDMYPRTTSMRMVVVFEIVCSVIMATIVFGRAISSIRTLPEYGKTRTIKARFLNGVIEPLEKIEIPEGKEIAIIILELPEEEKGGGSE